MNEGAISTGHDGAVLGGKALGEIFPVLAAPNL